MARDTVTPPSRATIFAGLFLALVAPFLSYLCASPIFGAAQTLTRIEWGTVIHWLNLFALIYLVLKIERQPLSSIGARPVRWWTIPAGVGLGIAMMLTFPLIAMLNSFLGLAMDEHFVTALMALPFWIRLLLVLTAGIFEETLFRGYAIERITYLTGSKWIAGFITLVAFTLAHTPAVGFTHLLPVFIVGAYMTALYLWRRDLVLNIVVHLVIDGVQLLLMPMAK
jgi:membrane protease YdiL (CAAX protease family)